MKALMVDCSLPAIFEPNVAGTSSDVPEEAFYPSHLEKLYPLDSTPAPMRCS
jgi:hypothetical protein